MRVLRRFVLPFFFKKAGEKIFKDMEGRMRNQTQEKDARSEGEVRVEKNSDAKSTRVEDGEYVSYEEVK